MCKDMYYLKIVKSHTLAMRFTYCDIVSRSYIVNKISQGFCKILTISDESCFLFILSFVKLENSFITDDLLSSPIKLFIQTEANSAIQASKTLFAAGSKWC